ncbi:MAG TPA: head-tail connector protein [Arsenophonus nasoniae]|uniref:Head-tail connector protein n=1 Tax=Arsenophonus nasoniae TaxID=638 RepID=A0AA95K5B7_9GAMM|nr:head-tail connector protein [Arsenophonus nasoniae]WGL96900.1 head-tail connector protein [Arsenophonus nasoniae]
MPLPTLAKLKAQCRIDENNNLEDELLITYLMAAKKRAENYINRTIYENDVPDTDPDGVALSADIELALLLAVDHFYENRETITVPAGFKALIEPYRYLNVG